MKKGSKSKTWRQFKIVDRKGLFGENVWDWHYPVREKRFCDRLRKIRTKPNIGKHLANWLYKKAKQRGFMRRMLGPKTEMDLLYEAYPYLNEYPDRWKWRRGYGRRFVSLA